MSSSRKMKKIQGYAAVFNRADLGGDEIASGAFQAGLAAAYTMPAMLYQHDATRPIGRWTCLRETSYGLWAEGEFAEALQLADEVAALVEQKILTGLSIGFRARKAQAGKGPVKRRLLAVDLVEISLVTFPMQPLARLHGTSTEDAIAPSLVRAGSRLSNLV